MTKLEADLLYSVGPIGEVGLAFLLDLFEELLFGVTGPKIFIRKRRKSFKQTLSKTNRNFNFWRDILLRFLVPLLQGISYLKASAASRH